MPFNVVDKIIESMDNRISLVISSKGQKKNTSQYLAN